MKVISTKKAPAAIGPYSQAIQVGNLGLSLKRTIIVLLTILLSVTVEAQTTLKKVYNEDIDPIEQIDQALVKAKAEGKFVVCQVGGNWCPWCLRFADFITNDTTISKVIGENFEYIHVNYNPRKSGDAVQQQKAAALMKRLDNCGRFGFPVFVILDGEGNVLHIQDSSFLEEGQGYNQEKVLRFFKNWTPKAAQVPGSAALHSQEPRRQGPRREAFLTDTPMVHDPVMAKEDDTYYIYSTGRGIQQMTSKDRKTWTVLPQPVMTVIPGWTTDSVPGFSSHVWAPDVIQWHGRWWMAYSCSTFGKNGSAIGLLSSRSLADNLWKDEGCIVASHDWKVNADGTTSGNNWNAIDPNFVIDDNDQPWLVWGSFWDGIQLARLDSTMHASWPRTIARRYDPNYKPTEENPTSKYAGTNAIEAPFIFKHGGYYYLFVSWDYCCRGAKSNYRVAVGRSKTVEGPYLDRNGKDMAMGGGTLFLEGDKKEWEAAGHCAAYTFDGEDVFICHGYSTTRNGAALLIQRPISWTADGWPELK